MRELVSCILPTKDRPGFFRVALSCFLRRTWRESELIVVDDGAERVESLCAGIERVRYLGLPGPANLGAKMNLGIQAARGAIVQKLDDDDYYSRDFIATAVTRLLESGRTDALVAWDCFLILHPAEGRLRYSGHGWKAGGTLCFPRTLWETCPFRDVPRSVDSWFARDSNAHLLPVCAPEKYILVRHGRNTWNRMQGGLGADDFLRTLPDHSKRLAEIVDPEALTFYESLRG